MGISGSHDTRAAASGIFKLADKSGDQELTLEEFKQYFDLPPEKASEIIKKYSRAKPNTLTKEEFTVLVESFYDEFRKFDKDGDGYISLEDAIQYYTKTLKEDKSLPPKEKDKKLVSQVKLLMSLDQGDGKVGFQEFVEGRIRAKKDSK
eukprot:PhF_6_TR17423/c0_g1_i1/m.26664